MARPATYLALALAAATRAQPPTTALHLWQCTPGTAGQAWTRPSAANGSIALASNAATFLAINTAYARNVPLLVTAAAPSLFSLSGGALTSAVANHTLCVQSLFGVVFHGASLGLDACAPGGAPAQGWVYSAADGTLRSAANASLCADVGSSNPCDAADAARAYCNPALPAAARAADLAARLSAAEASALLYADLIVESYFGANAGLPQHGVPPLWYGECLHGAVSVCGAPAADGSTSGCASSFPAGLAVGGSLNRSAWAALGAAVSTEVRGLNAQGLHGLACWAPNINPFRDPRWGRGHETVGEDAAVIQAEYAATYAAALQAEGDARTLKTLATCKHHYGYDLENSDNVTRTTFDARISQRDLVEYFWPPFRSCVERARTRSLMCSYNEVNGVPSCANGAFQNDIARGQWGFSGAIVSDCDAVQCVRSFGYANSSSAVMRAVFEGGLDINCGATVARDAAAAVADGNITLALLRASAVRTLTMWFETGFMDPPALNPYAALGAGDVDTPAHRALALQVAQQGATLLRNDASPVSPNGANTPILPLPATVRRVAVVGPHYNSTQALLGNYSPLNTVVNAQSVLQALQRRGARAGFSVAAAPGCAGVACADTAGFSAALAAAAGADVVVAVMGRCADGCPGGDADKPFIEGEGRDRASLALPGKQEALLAALLAAEPRVPVVVLLVHGGPLAIEWTAAHMPAVLTMWYPGEMGGDAAAGLLFGDVSPSGRSMMTWYDSSFETQRRVSDMTLAPHTGADGRAMPGGAFNAHNRPPAARATATLMTLTHNPTRAPRPSTNSDVFVVWRRAAVGIRRRALLHDVCLFVGGRADSHRRRARLWLARRRAAELRR
jgi:beta-D-xylosidase 4